MAETDIPSPIIINIVWEKIQYDELEISKLNKDIDGGMYQIYGNHPAYGPDALIYIGKAEKFCHRLKKRNEFKEACITPTYIRIGRITAIGDDKKPFFKNPGSSVLILLS